MISEAIEQLKRSFTDKYVEVHSQLPELARFAGLTGQIKTVNMNGRALVEFANYHLSTGWYDIDLDELQIVPAPDLAAAVAAKPAPAKASPVVKEAAPAIPAPVAKAAPAAKERPAEKTEVKKPVAKPQAAGGRMSVADMLAAARTGDSAPAAKPAAVAPAIDAVRGVAPTTDSAKPQAVVAESSRTSRAKLTAADILAMATSSKRIELLHAERRPMRVASGEPLRPATPRRTSSETVAPLTAAEILALQGKPKVKVQPVASAPLPKAAAAKPAPAKPTPAKAAPAAPAVAKEAKVAPAPKNEPAAKPQAAGGRPSLAEMLAMCRDNTPLDGAAPAAAAEVVAEVVAAPVAPAPVKSSGGRLSVAEQLAACRAADGGA